MSDQGTPVTSTAPLLEVGNLSIAFPRARGYVLAADRVNFALCEGRTLGVVGESGSGKSVTLRSIVGLVPAPGEIIEGRIAWRGRDLVRVPEKEFAELRGRDISMIFQDPTASLNPVYPIGEQIAETLRVKLGVARRPAREQAVALLERVGIQSAKDRASDYPHQLSGGMRQRVMIAIAVSCGPALLLADEPTTALDVTIQDQVLALLSELQHETGMAMIIVSHDLAVVAQTCDDIAVMYAGHIVEAGTRAAIIDAPRHPYTQALLAAAPSIAPVNAGQRLSAIHGQPPDLVDLPPGCPFAPRCPYAQPACSEVSMLLDHALPAHGSACPYGPWNNS